MKLDLIGGRLVDLDEIKQKPDPSMDDMVERFKKGLIDAGIGKTQIGKALSTKEILDLVQKYIELDKSIKRMNAVTNRT